MFFFFLFMNYSFLVWYTQVLIGIGISNFFFLSFLPYIMYIFPYYLLCFFFWVLLLPSLPPFLPLSLFLSLSLALSLSLSHSLTLSLSLTIKLKLSHKQSLSLYLSLSLFFFFFFFLPSLTLFFWGSKYTWFGEMKLSKRK
jgi:hypothetical protein